MYNVSKLFSSILTSLTVNFNVVTDLLMTEYYILYGATYFKTTRKSTAVVMMTKLENSTAMALTEGEKQKWLRN